MLRPPALTPGAAVGVVAPSDPAAALFPARLERALRSLSRCLQVEVRVAPHVRAATGFTSGTARQRARELTEFILDDSVAAVFTTLGGYNSNELLPLLDLELLRPHPKILVGYSDTTALLAGLHCALGWTTFYGPAVMKQFGEIPEPFPFTVNHLLAVLTGARPPLALGDPEGWTHARERWGDEDAAPPRPRALRRTGGRAVWREGTGQGRLFGGNLETLNLLAGTPYFRVPAEDVVLFCEATGAEAFLPRVRRALVHLRACGLLDRTRALLVGRSPDAEPWRGTTLREVVLSVVADYDFPVLGDVAFGHTDPMLTLPLGVRARVHGAGGASQFELLESAVAPAR